ncbi:hypothetical protein [Aeromicrobium sp. Leaf291]|uniref:hypothetical protein n=1 Tax=Aeromicrobium sp. Leaf291 TaxID=1736325 RepID=UPI0012E208E1|nr:hypothetical protein [Aeromicrobium sp. Leaf291]
MTQRRELSDETSQELVRLRTERDDATDAYKRAVIAALDEGSIREVMRVTGLAMDTIQRWRRELT